MSTPVPARGSPSPAAGFRASPPARPSSRRSRAEDLSATPFADRLAALVAERRSQICLGLDPDPRELGPAGGVAMSGGAPDSFEGAGGEASAAARAAGAVGEHCRRLIELAGPACVAVKPQLACFERLGPPGWAALSGVCEAARRAGLLVIADGKRGDVPVTAEAYAQALIGETPTPWGPVPGLGADAMTANPLLGRDSLEPLVDAAARAGAGVFVLVRTSNPGAAELQDLDASGRPLHEHLAELVASIDEDLAGSSGLSGAGAVVGATAPELLPGLRRLMPRSVLLIPGVGAQGGRSADLGPAFAAGPASALVAASRSVASAGDPAAAARELRDAVWAASAA